MSKPTTDATPILFESTWWTRLAAISEQRRMNAIESQRRKRKSGRFTLRVGTLLRTGLMSVFVK